MVDRQAHKLQRGLCRNLRFDAPVEVQACEQLGAGGRQHTQVALGLGAHHNIRDSAA
jgi:hypothetical protein